MTGSEHRLKESRDGRRILPLNYLYSGVSRRKSKQKKNQNAAHSSRLVNSEIARAVVVKAVSKGR